MATIADIMPPTPQQHPYQQHMPSMASPQQTSAGQSHAHGLQNFHNPNHGFAMSFDPSHQQSFSQPAPSGFAQSFPNGPISNHGFARSFGNGNKGAVRPYNDNPQIYTAAYSGVSVYELEVATTSNGVVACMRRRSDGWLNATQILKVAGVDKGKRTKVLEKEILGGEHEKVQGGYGKYQGTWISYQRGREFCRQYGVEEILRPLLEYDILPDGTSGQGQETPTKEQAMAAQRKRFYNSNQEPRPNGPSSNGTFLSNIGPNASAAVAAIHKARLDSPTSRPASAQQKAHLVRQPSHSQLDGVLAASQQSMHSDASEKTDSGYSTQPNGEPPRKRMRADNGYDGMAPPDLPLNASIRSATPTEPNESFLYDNALMQESKNHAGEPIALPPLPNPINEDQQEKMNLILDLFAEQTRSDYSSHPALAHLSNEDWNMPLDASANNALHWAATLAKVPLLKLLIQKGASIWRGNAAGQSPLVSAVLVNNCWDASCFSELLDHLGPLIEVRDLQGRTILHHIAVSAGIKGRAHSSKYYLETLLEFLVRVGVKNAGCSSQSVPSVAAAAADASTSTHQMNAEDLSQDSIFGQPRGPVTFVRFLQHIVNARDKAGNSALNLAARISNRSIIQQLLEIHADPDLPNNKGITAKDFGVGVESGEQVHINGAINSSQQSYTGVIHPDLIAAQDGPVATPSISQVEETGQAVLSSMTSMLTQSLASHKELLRSRTEQIDRVNAQIQELSAVHKSTVEELHAVKARLRLREERKLKIANLQREIAKKRAAKKRTYSEIAAEPQWLIDASAVKLADTADGTPTASQRQLAVEKLPSPSILRAHVNAYNTTNGNLQQQAEQLRSHSIELEAMYRKVVAMCTGVPEEQVEDNLASLVAAVESERGSIGEHEVGRVRDFLRRVDVSQQSLEVNPTVSALAAAAAAAAARIGK